MHKRIIFCCLLVILSLLTIRFWNQNKDPLEPSSTMNGLKLEISALRNKVSPTDDIQIEYKLVNTDKGYVTIFSLFYPLDFVSPNLPQNQITFLIKSPDANVCKYSGNPYYPKFAYQSICKFISLGSSSFYGGTISLKKGDFAYSISAKGKYKIQAIYKTDARDWLSSHLAKMGLTEKEIPFSLQRVFNGTLVSNEIEIEVN